jgi:Ni/Co efflux regulator RcnB
MAKRVLGLDRADPAAERSNLMNRFATAAIAAFTFIAPLAVAPVAAADPPGYSQRDRNHRADRRDNRRDHRADHRNDRRDDRWDRRRHNGYSVNGRFHYGPPPAHVRNVRYEYRNWRRGDRLPSYYRQNYVVVNDYHRARLRAPPRGYHYVRDDRGDTLLVGIATGVILGVILSQ